MVRSQLSRILVGLGFWLMVVSLFLTACFFWFFYGKFWAGIGLAGLFVSGALLRIVGITIARDHWLEP